MVHGGNYVPRSFLRKIAAFPKVHDIASAGLERDSFFHSPDLFLRKVISPISNDTLANKFSGCWRVLKISHNIL